jgi:hypothetical protein
MKVLLAIAVGVLIFTVQAQTGIQGPAELLVLKFSCGRYEARSRVIRSVQDPDPPMNEPIRINQVARNEPQEVINRRDLQERRAEMKAAEINAARSGQAQSTLYFYRLEIKNASTKAVKNFAWAYQPGESPDPSDRQFFCVVKAKSNESKTFELFSPLGPSRVIDASKAGDKSEKDSRDKVIINRIEYVDGSVWQRPLWNPATFSGDATTKVASGKCIGL